jgi:hypothetical protein
MRPVFVLLLLAVSLVGFGQQPSKEDIPALKGWTLRPEPVSKYGRVRRPGDIKGKWLYERQYWRGKARLMIHAVRCDDPKELRKAEQYYRGTSGAQMPMKDKEIEAVGLSPALPRGASIGNDGGISRLLYARERPSRRHLH